MQRKRNEDKLTVPLDSTAQYAPVKALAKVIASNTHNCIDSAWQAFYLETYYGPYWSSTAHLRQPSTQNTWTTGYVTRYAPTPPNAGSNNTYLVQKPSYYFITTTIYTGDSSLPYARPITITSSISTPST